MSELPERIFVGRRAELDRWAEILANPQGQAVVVVGQAGMGKTMLVNRMAASAAAHPDLKCGQVRYEVTPTDSPAATMSLMLDHAFEAARLVERSREKTEHRRNQWLAIIRLIGDAPAIAAAAMGLPGAAPPVGSRLGELVQSLRRDPQRSTRDQFLERLRLISDRLPDDGRAVFVIDPEKYMADQSQDDWRLVVRDLPDKIKFIFAQRPEDVLIASPDFMALEKVCRVPDERLNVLADQEVEDLIQARSPEIDMPERDLREAVQPYAGHPYAVSAALDLIADGRPLNDLPPDPTPERIAETQWTQLRDKHGPAAIQLFEAYAVLEVARPDEVVEAVSDLSSTARKALLANPFLAGLLRTEQDRRRIYHTLLTDHIRTQLGDTEAKTYHQRAIEIYRDRLNADTKPDALAAVRLSQHVLEAEGDQAFVKSFVDECGQSLISLGQLDAFVALSRQAQNLVEPGSKWEAMVLGNLGVIYQTRGEPDRAEEMHRKSLAIGEKLGRLEDVASQYGNLGLIYRMRGDLDRAEEMFRKVLTIEEKLGRPDSVANAYGNLGLIYHMRGDLDRAEEMHRKSLAIEEKLGRLEGMASDYGNLGAIYRTRGDLDRAEEMHRKALAINEKLGRLEGMANNYANLGTVFENRGDRVTARDYWTKARDLYAGIGMPHMVDKLQGWIDILPPPPDQDTPA